MDKAIFLCYEASMGCGMASVLSLGAYALAGSEKVPGAVTLVFLCGTALTGIAMFAMIFISVLNN